MAIKVCAKAPGYFGEYREPGDEFEIQSEKQFSQNWMTKVESDEGKQKGQGKAKASKSSEASKEADLDVI